MITLKKIYCLLIAASALKNVSAQSDSVLFDKIYKYAVEKDYETDVLYFSESQQVIGIHFGAVQKIISLRDSMIYEPSYPWHRKTYMAYHFKDYPDLLKTDTNLHRYNTWIDLKVEEKLKSGTLHKFALPLDSLKHPYLNKTDSIYAWVLYRNSPPQGWAYQALRNAMALKGLPENAQIIAVKYGSSIFTPGNLSLHNKTMRMSVKEGIMKFGASSFILVTMKQMLEYVEKGKMWSR